MCVCVGVNSVIIKRRTRLLKIVQLFPGLQPHLFDTNCIRPLKASYTGNIQALSFRLWTFVIKGKHQRQLIIASLLKTSTGVS